MQAYRDHTGQFLFPNPVGLKKSALIMPHGDISFEALDRSSRLLANRIIEQGVGDVLVCLPYGTLYYVALVACMHAGRPAVPIDPDLPVHMLKEQISRVRPTLAILEVSEADLLPLECPVLFVHYSDFFSGECMREMKPANASSDIPVHHSLHRLFTSGSIGYQTLVTISRSAMLHDVSTTPSIYGLTNTDTLSNIGRYTSSLHINAFWRCLQVGAGFMPVDIKSSSAESIISRWKMAGITILQGHPSLLDMLCPSSTVPTAVPSVRQLIMGGEPLKIPWLSHIRQWLPGLEKISHNYSSTETMLITCRTYSVDEIDGLNRMPAGFPVPGKQVCIVDDDGEELPSGFVGEIIIRSFFIGSVMEGLDAAVRLQEDINSGLRSWRTRDLGRWMPDGTLEHLGRVDRQMKINGQRIDPVYVEQCMETMDDVVRSLVFSVNIEHSEQHLVAVFIGNKYIEANTIRTYLRGRLPLAHIPSGIFQVDKLPVTPRGKPDLNALEQFVRSQWQGIDRNHYLCSREKNDELRSFLQKQWTELLPFGHFDAKQSVFDQGADSIMLLKMISVLTDAFGLNLTIAFLLRNPTLDMQVSALEAMMRINIQGTSANMIKEIQQQMF